MLPSLRSAGLGVVSVLLFACPARAGMIVECGAGFTKILEQDGTAVCRRSRSVASSDLAESLSQMWWGEAACSGQTSDRQSGISQNQNGEWTVTMRFFCNGF